MTKILIDGDTRLQILEIKQIEKKLFDNIEKYIIHKTPHYKRLCDYYQSLYAKFKVK